MTTSNSGLGLGDVIASRLNVGRRLHFALLALLYHLARNEHAQVGQDQKIVRNLTGFGKLILV